LTESKIPKPLSFLGTKIRRVLKSLNVRGALQEGSPTERPKITKKQSDRIRNVRVGMIKEPWEDFGWRTPQQEVVGNPLFPALEGGEGEEKWVRQKESLGCPVEKH